MGGLESYWGGRTYGTWGLFGWKGIQGWIPGFRLPNLGELSDRLQIQALELGMGWWLCTEQLVNGGLGRQRQHMPTAKVGNKTSVSFFCPFFTPFMMWSHPTDIKLWFFASENDLVRGVFSLLTCANLPSFPNTQSGPISQLMGCPFHLCQPPYFWKYMAHPTLWISSLSVSVSYSLWPLQ